MRRHEYRFVRLDAGGLSVRSSARRERQETIAEHARQGWRPAGLLVPGRGASGAAKDRKLPLEREVRGP